MTNQDNVDQRADDVDTGLEPVMSGTLFHSTEDLSRFFVECEDQLPVFLGESLAEHVTAWQALTRKGKWTSWRQAAVAASLVRAFGKRTDVGGGETVIQQFCRTVAIGPEHFSRLTRVYRTFGEQPLDASLKELLEDDALSFKHLYVAANHAVQPAIALREAKELGWSANELGRVQAARKGRTLLDADGTPVRAVDDDDFLDVSWRGMPEPHRTEAERPRGTRQVALLLTAKQHAVFARQLRALSDVLGTTGDTGTVLAIVERAHAEWVATSAGDALSGEPE